MMMIARNFFHRSQSEASTAPAFSSAHRDPLGKVHVAMYSKLFSESAVLPLWSNSMYQSLRYDIENSIDLFNTREKIMMDIYETGESTDLDRERALIGFHKYMKDCYLGSKRQNTAHLLLFLVFLLLGLALIFLLYSLCPQWIPQWIFILMDTVAAVFIWQFVGYMAFEYPVERKKMRRIRQIIGLEFTFHHWD